MLFSEKVGKAKPDGNIMIWLLKPCPWVMFAAAQPPALLASMKPVWTEQAVGRGLPAFQDIILTGWTAVICTVPLLGGTPEFKRSYETANLSAVRSKNCCRHWGLLNGGYALGLMFQGLWWPLNVQRLRAAAPFLPCKGWLPLSNLKGYEQHACGNSGLLREQFLLLPSQKKWTG